MNKRCGHACLSYLPFFAAALTIAPCKTSYYAMTKTITKVGNSQGIIFDTALMDLARIKVGDKVNITVHPGGSIVLTPIQPVIEAGAAAKRARHLIKKNAALFKRLS